MYSHTQTHTDIRINRYLSSVSLSVSYTVCHSNHHIHPHQVLLGQENTNDTRLPKSVVLFGHKLVRPEASFVELLIALLVVSYAGESRWVKLRPGTGLKPDRWSKLVCVATGQPGLFVLQPELCGQVTSATRMESGISQSQLQIVRNLKLRQK